MTSGQASEGVPACHLRLWELAGGTRTPNMLFTRQERIVHGVLACAVLAGRGQMGRAARAALPIPLRRRLVALLQMPVIAGFCNTAVGVEPGHGTAG